MAKFNKKNWLNVGDSGANDNNSVLNKTTMNDLENRIEAITTTTRASGQSSDDDMNNYTENGIYYFPYQPKNSPPVVNGFLVVMSYNNTVKQLFFRHGTANSNDFETYVRTRNDATTWSDWTKFFVERTRTGTVTCNSAFTNINVNKYTKVGNLVHIYFRIQATKEISGGQPIITLPFKAVENPNDLNVWISDGQYDIGTKFFAYVAGNLTAMHGDIVPANKWIHGSFWYVCE